MFLPEYYFQIFSNVWKNTIYTVNPWYVYKNMPVSWQSSTNEIFMILEQKKALLQPQFLWFPCYIHYTVKNPLFDLESVSFSTGLFRIHCSVCSWSIFAVVFVVESLIHFILLFSQNVLFLCMLEWVSCFVWMFSKAMISYTVFIT